MSYVVSTWLGGFRDDATKIDVPTRDWTRPFVATAREKLDNCGGPDPVVLSAARRENTSARTRSSPA
jgi:hypothetical protein